MIRFSDMGSTPMEGNFIALDKGAIEHERQGRRLELIVGRQFIVFARNLTFDRDVVQLRVDRVWPGWVWAWIDRPDTFKVNVHSRPLGARWHRPPSQCIADRCRHRPAACGRILAPHLQRQQVDCQWERWRVANRLPTQFEGAPGHL
ncbi:hypothetical protein D3C79_728950 [compost metagenome]